MPSANDVIRVLLLFSDVDSEAIINVFTMRLANVVTASWSGIADEIENLFNSMYADYLDHVPTQTGSESFTVSLRDESAGQWDEVIHRDFIDLVGSAATDPYASLNAATIVAYPGLVRHWGFKNLPAVGEGSVASGRLTLQVIADMILFGVDYARNWAGVESDLSQGVYNEASETFRPFAASILVKDAMGSRVTRKAGEGI